MYDLKEHKKEYYQRIKAAFPWMSSYNNAKKRCNNKNHPVYHRYGGRNIKFLLTKIKIKKLWFRDKAYLMSIPTIDRKENDGNYEYKNCRFIELAENAARSSRKAVIQYSKTGKRKRKFISITEASKITKICTSSIGAAVNNQIKMAGNFVWKFAK